LVHCAHRPTGSVTSLPWGGSTATELATNCLLILTQRPGATQVAGFHVWKALGRSAMKGAKGTAIFAPLCRGTGGR
jgi:hypothetical protein